MNCADRGSTGAALMSWFHQLSAGKSGGSAPRRSGGADCACTAIAHTTIPASSRKRRGMVDRLGKSSAAAAGPRRDEDTKTHEDEDSSSSCLLRVFVMFVVQAGVRFRCTITSLFTIGPLPLLYTWCARALRRGIAPSIRRQ